MTYSALFHYPFQKNLIPQEFLTYPRLITNAAYHSDIYNAGNTVIVQHNQIKFDGWKDKDISLYHDVNHIDAGTIFKTAFCHIPQSKEHALFMMAQILEKLEDGCLLICIAGNNENGKRLQKWFKDFGLRAQSESKQKQRIVWAYKENIHQENVNECLEKYGIQKQNLNNKSFYTKPGIYGWKKIDKGSQSLVNSLPPILKGYGADFGCGYGFLSEYLASEHENIQSIDLYDADYYAIECAKNNLKDAQCQLNFILQDLLSLQIQRKYNWIVMNPPFHQGKEKNTDIGADFIKKASESLQASGMLYMVANDFLPYEKIIAAHFKKFETVKEENGFKVIFAQK